jgi:ATP-dependent DNA helicase PIF1
LVQRAILTPLNENMNRLNALGTSMLTGEAKIYHAQDSVSDTEYGGTYATEFLNGLDPSNLPPFELSLKVGQPVILIRNMDARRGRYNNTRMVDRALGRKLIDFEIVLGPFRGSRFFLPRVSIETDDGTATPVKFARYQFPIKPAFVMTVNRSQGQTLQAVGLFFLIMSLVTLICTWPFLDAATRINSKC